MGESSNTTSASGILWPAKAIVSVFLLFGGDVVEDDGTSLTFVLGSSGGVLEDDFIPLSGGVLECGLTRLTDGIGWFVKELCHRLYLLRSFSGTSNIKRCG
jgi:hypothetical protein